MSPNRKLTPPRHFVAHRRPKWSHLLRGGCAEKGGQIWPVTGAGLAEVSPEKTGGPPLDSTGIQRRRCGCLRHLNHILVAGYISCNKDRQKYWSWGEGSGNSAREHPTPFCSRRLIRSPCCLLTQSKKRIPPGFLSGCLLGAIRSLPSLLIFQTQVGFHLIFSFLISSFFKKGMFYWRYLGFTRFFRIAQACPCCPTKTSSPEKKGKISKVTGFAPGSPLFQLRAHA